MRATIAFVGCLLALCGEAKAGTIYAELRYAELKLSDGRVLADATVKSFDDLTGNVSVKVGKSLLSVQMAALPDDVQAKLRAMAPEKTPEEKAAALKREQERLAKAEKARQAQEKRALQKLRKDEDSARRINEKRAEKEMDRERDTPALVLNAAQVRANNYFKTDRIEYDDPEQVPGWSNRWRVKGRAFGGTILGKGGGGSGRGYRDFEIIVEDTGKGSPRVLEVNDKL